MIRCFYLQVCGIRHHEIACYSFLFQIRVACQWRIYRFSQEARRPCGQPGIIFCVESGSIGRLCVRRWAELFDLNHVLNIKKNIIDL